MLSAKKKGQKPSGKAAKSKPKPSSRRDKTRVKDLGPQPYKLIIKGVTYWRVKLGPRFLGPGADRIEQTFRSYDAAKTFIENRIIVKINQGTQALHMPESASLEAVNCWKKLAALPFPATLTEAVDHFILHRAPKGRVTLKTAIAQFIEKRWKLGRGPEYVRGCERELNRFLEAVDVPGKDGKQTHVHDVTRQQVEAFLDGDGDEPRAPKTFNNLRGTLSVFYSWAIDQGYSSLSPIEKIEKRRLHRMIPGILTPEKMAALLQGAIDHGMPDLIPGFVLAAFGCFRRAEIIRLRWDQVEFRATEDPKEEGRLIGSAVVKLDGNQAKTRSWRAVNVSANLHAWLQKYRQESGPVVPYADLEKWPLSEHLDRTRFRDEDDLKEHHASAVEGWRRQELLRKLDWEKWPHNALRHSCASYSLAIGQDDARLALSMGHSVQVLHARYKAIVSEAHARKYFSILP